MADRLAVSAILLVCVVWGAWLNYVATARVNEGEVQINYFSDFFFAELHLIQYVVFLSCGFSCEDVLKIISAIICSKRP